MRRWLAILLLTLLPIQFSWAAVASYCNDEAPSQTQHLGHHVHQHPGLEDPPAAQDATAKKSTGSMDLDCVHCHVLCAAMLLGEKPFFPPLSTSPPASLADVPLQAHPPAPPERPQWADLA